MSTTEQIKSQDAIIQAFQLDLEAAQNRCAGLEAEIRTLRPIEHQVRQNLTDSQLNVKRLANQLRFLCSTVQPVIESGCLDGHDFEGDALMIQYRYAKKVLEEFP